ncbi:hypothetical protein HYR53_04050 [Candidatus Acetothermia bacterium]|nr:hypothetical protein [Candidatus Acetothermia bacterium]
MLTLQDLADRYGLSYKQVRDRMTALGPLIDPYLLDGKQNTKLLNDSGFAIFDRLVQIEQHDHLTMKAAAAVLAHELESNGKSSGLGDLGKQINALQSRAEDQEQTITKLKHTVERCQDRISSLESQVHPMLPSNVFASFWRRFFHSRSPMPVTPAHSD